MGNMNTLLGDAFFDQKAWDAESTCYDVMNSMEAKGTERELDEIGIKESDTVLDIGCGSGRMSIPIARRAKQVIAIDSSEAMIEICNRNIKESGLSNIDCLRLDWERDEDYQKLPQVDIIIQARWSGGASSLEKYKGKGKKVVIIEWTKNPPRVVRDTLFKDCYSEEAIQKYPELAPFDLTAYTDANEGNRIKEARDRKLRDELKTAGIELHSKIVQGGMEYFCSGKEEMEKKLIYLSNYPHLVNLDKFKDNILPYIEEKEDGWLFYYPTWSKIEWFNT